MGDLSEVQCHLHALHFLRQQIQPQPTYEGYVLDNGTVWTAEDYGPEYDGDFEAIPQQCFNNCANIVIVEGPDRYTYVEGWATTGILPVHHAWLVAPDGRIVDPTWGHRGTEYVGVTFTDTELFEAANTQEHGFSMLYPMGGPHPLLEATA